MKNISFNITADGSIGLYDKDLDEIYHCKEGARQESFDKFINPCNFELLTKTKNKLNVLDICYGIGYNTKAALSFHKNCELEIDAVELNKELVFLSPFIEYDEEINSFLFENVSKLEDFKQPLKEDFIKPPKKEHLISAKINFYLDDARKVIPNLNKKYDVIFLDAFAPSKQPTLWSVEFLSEIKKLMNKDAILATYCSAQVFRGALKENGFFIGKTLNNNGKSQGTVASLNKELIKFSLEKQEEEMINTKAGIPYRDENLNNSSEGIFKTREIEVKNSNRQSASAFKKSLMKHYILL